MATATEVLPPAAAEQEKWRPSTQGWIARRAVLLLILGAVIFLTATVEGFWADRISRAAIFAVIGLSLNIVLGYIGQVSLGHQAFVGIAAFVAAYYATEKAGCEFEGCSMSTFLTSTVIAALSGAVAAGILGIVALRIRGLYLALITLAYGLVSQNSIFEISFLTRGGAGMPAVRPDGWVSDNAFAFLTLIFLAAVIFVDWSMMRSKVGRAILAVKHSEPVAASYGINVTGYKIIAFVLSGLFAGIAGSLFAFRNQNVVANDFFFAETLTWVLMVVVGGLGNRVGVIVGSAFFALFGFIVEPILHWLGGLWTPLHFLEEAGAQAYVVIIVGAALAILTIIEYPGGIGQQISPITRWLGGQRLSMHPEGEGHHKPQSPKELKTGVMSRLGLQRSATEEHAEGTTEDAAETSTMSRVAAPPPPPPPPPDVLPDDEPVAHVSGSVEDPSVADADPVPEESRDGDEPAPRRRGFLGKLGLQRNPAAPEEEKTS
jgi:branched-chain amino acid transport system permease protein